MSEGPYRPPQNLPGARIPAGSNAALSRRWTSSAGTGASPRPPGPRITGAMPPASATRPRRRGESPVRVRRSHPRDPDSHQRPPVGLSVEHGLELRRGDGHLDHGRPGDRFGAANAFGFEELHVSGGASDRRRLLLDLLRPSFERDLDPLGCRDDGGGKRDRIQRSPSREQSAVRRPHHTSCLRERPDLDGDLDDRPERPEGPRREPVHVVARDALDRPRAASNEPPITRHELDLDDGVAQGTHPESTRRGRRGGDRPADGRVVGGIGGPFLPSFCEDALKVADPHPSLDDGQHLRGVVGDHAIETRRRELHIDLARVAFVSVGPAADDRDTRPAFARREQCLADLSLRSRLDQIHVPSGMA